MFGRKPSLLEIAETSMNSLDYFLGLEGEPFFNQLINCSLPQFLDSQFPVHVLFILYVKHHKVSRLVTFHEGISARTVLTSKWLVRIFKSYARSDRKRKYMRHS